MVTTLGVILSVVALAAATVMWLMIIGKFINFLSNLPIFLIILFAGVYAVFGLIFLPMASMLTTELFRKPVDIIVYDEQGEKVCEYNKVEEVDETRDGLSFEIDGKKHIVQNYSWEWSE